MANNYVYQNSLDCNYSIIQCTHVKLVQVAYMVMLHDVSFIEA